MEIPAFLDRHLYGSFRTCAMRLVHVNSLTFHSLDASAYGHLSLSLSLFSLILGFVSFSLSSQSTHTRRNIARSSKRSFAVRDTRVNIHAPVVVAFRCIFTPESSLPRYIFIRREWYVTGFPPIQRMTGGGDITREKDWSIRESLDCYLVEVQREIYSQHPPRNSLW